MKVYVHNLETGDLVERELREDEFPSQITVFCDDCKITTKRDYVVSEGMSKPERFEVARTVLRREGWQCDESGDRCPECKTTTAAEQGEAATR